MLSKGNLSPLILQGLGIAMLVVFIAFWMITGQESALLVGAALTLIASGSASGALLTIKQEVRGEPTSEKARQEKSPETPPQTP